MSKNETNNETNIKSKFNLKSFGGFLLKSAAIGLSSYFLINIPLDYIADAVRYSFLHGNSALSKAFIAESGNYFGWINDLYITGDNFVARTVQSFLSDTTKDFQLANKSDVRKAFEAQENIQDSFPSSETIDSSGDLFYDDGFSFDYDYIPTV